MLEPIYKEHRDLLVSASELLFGPEWQRVIARRLGAFHPDGPREAIDDRLVRRWTSGERPIPDWVISALISIADAGATDLSAMLGRLRSVHDAITRTAEKTISDLDDWLNRAREADDLEIVELNDETISELPLSRDELRNARVDLSHWRTPIDFRRTVHTFHKRSRSAEIFNNPRLNFLLDAWTLAEFVHHKSVDRIRLAPPGEEWPDGQVRIGGKVENVEVTIALEPGRRLGAEYRFTAKTELDPIENWQKRAEDIPSALEKAINDKIAKRYSDCGRMWLVVYLNINDYGIRQAECETAIAAVKHRYSASFGDLFVLWKDKLL